MSGILVFFAASEVDLSPWLQLITTGGFGALVWYLICIHQPHRDEIHDKHVTKAREDYLLALEKERLICSEERKVSMTELGKLRGAIEELRNAIRRHGDDSDQ